MRRNTIFESRVAKIVCHVDFNKTHKFSYNAVSLQVEYRKNKCKRNIKNSSQKKLGNYGYK